MMHEHGDDAELEAAISTDRMLRRGDREALLTWFRIRRAIVVMRQAPKACHIEWMAECNEALLTKWRMISPSAQAIVDPVSSARGIIRDTRVDGAYRFHWSVIPADEPLPIAAGRTGELARARSITREALRIYAEDWLDLVGAYTEAISLNP
jgi:hypothetical protein